jgi:hypothetical protein
MLTSQQVTGEFVALRSESAMASKQNLLSFIDTGRQVRRPPLVGMQFLHETPVRTTDFVRRRTWRNAKDLLGLVIGHFARSRRLALPRCRTTISVFTPAGIPAVEIRCE